MKETAKAIQKLDIWKDEYEEKIWQTADMDEINLVLWQVVDDKTHDLLISKGLEQYDSGYEEVTKFILAQIRCGEEREVLRRPANRDKDVDVQIVNLAHQNSEALTPDKI